MNTPALLTGMSRRPNRSSTMLMIGSAVLHTPSRPAPHRSLVRARQRDPPGDSACRPYRRISRDGHDQRSSHCATNVPESERTEPILRGRPADCLAMAGRSDRPVLAPSARSCGRPDSARAARQGGTPIALSTRLNHRVHDGLCGTLADGKPDYLGGRFSACGASGQHDPQLVPDGQVSGAPPSPGRTSPVSYP